MSAARSAPDDAWRPIHHADAPRAPLHHADATWTPIHHADPAKPSKPSKPEPREDADPEPSDEAEAAPASPAEVPNGLPPHLIEDIAQLADAQRDLADQIGALVVSLGAWTNDVHASMHSAHEPMIEAMQAALTSVIDGQKQLTAQVKQLAEAQPSVARSIAAWSESIEAAIRAPRRVSLERGQDGLATGAVSTVVPQPSPSRASL